MPETNAELVLKMKAAQPGVVSFYQELDKSSAAQKQFVADPEGYLKSAGVPLSVGTNNRLLFSLMANQRFNAWATKYDADLEKKYPAGTRWEDVDYAQISADVYNAIVEFEPSQSVDDAFGKNRPARIDHLAKGSPQPQLGWVVAWLYIVAYVLPIVVVAHRPIMADYLGNENLAHIVDGIRLSLQQSSRKA